ncbi:carboxymuconolactone decarboxylase family protein [Pelagicoccus sp. SDUM812002]|uniref:carboxymuconolactone decarboxylase family protein n=1 Tax=Pelagicoccus sp. SDUM812002 TaxID=3041266 RepID=UPI00280F3158|nr:carboxymuconolactone decarboxylase family protein [Pelagicoccus sp. SDUM812002]MDQ8184580.1 carboxymuconolactone decarboxylase family protein [Pelagicoccus sp. SDUM812002]
MNRIKLIEENSATPSTASLYKAVQSKLGLVPNMVKALGNSTVALEGYLALSGAVSKGMLRPSTREKIALLLAEANQCDYCLRAHTAISGSLKIPSEEITDARCGVAPDAKEQALLNLAQDILDTRGAVSDESFFVARQSGISDEEIAEVALNVAVSIYTNYFNRLAQTENDFPAVEACARQTA